MTSKIRETSRNFDWGETRRPLCIFMPNFQWPEWTEYAINKIETTIDEREYIIIIGNDNISHNWDHLRDKNVRYFTLERDCPKDEPRNGLFIRNYAIKRMQSELYLGKDSEVIMLGDFIYNALNFSCGWRPGIIHSLTKIETDGLLAVDKNWKELFEGEYDICTHCFPEPTMEVNPYVTDSAYAVKEMLEKADGQINPTTYFHYAYCVKLEHLQYLRGYDEEYSAYGWEDGDMYCRLFHKGVRLFPDPAISAVHPCHPRTSDSKPGQVANMRDLFVSKSPANIIRNTQGWGEGVYQCPE